MLRFSYLLTVATVIVALVALLRTRRVSQRLERLSESYWELRYEHGRLQARIAKLEGQPEPEPAGPPAATAFVPLSSLKR